MLPLFALLVAAPPAVPEVERLEVVSLVDNTYDCFQPDEKCATRHSLAHVDGFESIRLTAEMGLAFLIRYEVAGKPRAILFDFGLTERALENNIAKLGIDLSSVEALVLSHAHEDHYAGLAWAARRTKKPIYVGNAEAFLERRFVNKDRNWSMGALSREALEKEGSKVVEAPTPTVIAGGALLSGVIPQKTPYEKVPPFLKVKRGAELGQDSMSHELAVGLRVKGKGLVVITACAHAGVINSIEALLAASGEKKLHAVLGGMHLTSAPPETVGATVDALTAMAPAYLAPMHCTGDRAERLLAAKMPAAYVHPSTGTRYRF